MLGCAGQIIQNKYGKNNALPVELIIFVTNKCNLSCGHCFVDKDKTGDGVELSLREFEKISIALPHLLSLMITGGEPFLRDDLAEIVSVFDKNSRPKVISITTNGTLTGSVSAQLDKLYKLNLRSQVNLTLSIDGDADTHNRIRGNDKAFKQLKETIEVIKHHPIRSGIVFGMNVTIMEENEHLPFSVYADICDMAGMDFISCNLARGRSRDEYKNINIDHYVEIGTLINKRNRIVVNNIPALFRLTHKIKEEFQLMVIRDIYLKRRYQGIICEAGRNIGVIDPFGNVYPCELLGVKLGSLRECDLKTIWNSALNRDFSENTIRKKKCFCHHECFLSASLNTNIRNQFLMFIRSVIK